MKDFDEQPPFDTHCRNCGGPMTLNKAKKKRVRGIFRGQRNWEIDAVCSSCGTDSGGNVIAFKVGPPGPIVRSLRAFQSVITSIFSLNPSIGTGVGLTGLNRKEQSGRRAPILIRPDESIDLAQLVAAIPFKVYGMKGRPLGFHLTSFGHGTNGKVINHISFRYASGRREVEIDQSRLVWRQRHPQSDLSCIWSLLGGGRDFHRDWNLKKIESTPSELETFRIGRKDGELVLTSWHEPEQIIVAHMTVGDHSMRVTSLNLPRQELLECLATLVGSTRVPGCPGTTSRGLRPGISGDSTALEAPELLTHQVYQA